MFMQILGVALRGADRWAFIPASMRARSEMARGQETYIRSLMIVSFEVAGRSDVNPFHSTIGVSIGTAVSQTAAD